LGITETGSVSESGVASPFLSTQSASFKRHTTPLLLPHVLLYITQQPGPYTALLIIHCNDISQNTGSFVLPLTSQDCVWALYSVCSSPLTNRPLYFHTD